MFRLISILFVYLYSLSVTAEPAYRRISGYVFDQQTGTPLAGVNVYVADNKAGTVTNSEGHFAMSVAAESIVSLTFSSVGFVPKIQTILPKQQAEITVFLTYGQQLAEQVVKATSGSSISNNPQMSAISLSMEQLGKVPALLGEKDVMKLLQLMPGVQKGSEGNAGLYVRGGAPDQNLILLDNAPIYNPNHLLGFFSAFNGDALKCVDMTKGGFPARFGGRLSSVIELTTKDGQTDRFRGEASAGLVASRLTLSAPIGKYASFMVAGRRTYLDLLTGLLGQNTADQPVLKTAFFDLNAKLTIHAGPADKVYISGYTSQDKFTNGSALQSNLRWTNGAGSIRWNHQGRKGTVSDLSLIYSRYQMGVQDQKALEQSSQNTFYTLNYQSSIQDVGLKYDRTHYLNATHQIRFGGQLTHHTFNPQAYVSLNVNELPNQTSDQMVTAAEAGAYIEHSWSPANKWRFTSGLRLSAYSVLGGSSTTAETKTRPDSSATAVYIRPEPRLSIAYRVTPSFSIKGSYALMNQYLHLLSSTGVGLSTDLWVPTVKSIKPQQSQQVALGMAKDFSQSGLSLTIEGYYKKMSNLLSYREGASFLSADAQGNVNSAKWVDNVTSGQGRSYGAEILLQKQAGRLSGWIGYTLSWTDWQFAELNGGKTFHPRYDRRHDASIVGMYELTPAITLSASWVYGTGNSLTLPLSRFSGYYDQKAVGSPITSNALYGSGSNVKEYGERNSFQSEAYHRLDLSARFTKKRARTERVWEISVYNAYNRHNPFLYSLEGKAQEKGLPSKTVLYKYSLFPAIPSLSYTIRF
ncbi:TonB-dependent receptor [Spirosoma aerolatum]|uniref:TonB-dependent receptor n=1 Tax=Spirosoma aerolatum TaxID=1211326 RepID=UPI0009ABBDDF|nr:TonB-dependent receptor [Spirosoma aerolatum]